MATSETDDHVTKTSHNQPLHNETIRDHDLDPNGDGTSMDDVPDVAEILREAKEKSMRNLEERFTLYSRKCEELQRLGTLNPKKIQKSVRRLENYLMQKFKEKEPFIIDFTNDSTGTDHHRQALRKCRTLLLHDLDLRDRSVLERLYEDDVMSVTDKNSIICKPTQRLQNEEFFRYVEGRVTSEEFHRSLIPAMRKSNAHLADELLREEDILDETDSKCVVCKVYQTVELKRLAKPLLEMKAITSVLHADLRSAAITNSQKWAELEKARVSHGQIIQALKSKYPDFYHEFQRTVRRLECFCANRSVVSGPFPLTPSTTAITQTQHDGPDYRADVAQMDDLMTSYLGAHSYDSELEYPMNARPRGICLIINNVDFEEDSEARKLNPRLGNRVGSNSDVERLEKIFTKFEFKVQICTNLTDTGLVTVAVDMARQDHSKFDAFVCCVLSHCAKDVVYGTNCRTVRLSEITSPFRASACPTLAGKPKIFFIQGAQGSDRMKGLKVDESGVNPSSATASVKQNRQATNSQAMGDIEASIIPDEADFLFGYSTFPGYVSYRSRDLGSWYIIKLAEILEKQADRHDLLSCLLMVNEEISKGNAFMGDGVFKQVPAPVFTLRRKVNLTSNPAWHESLYPQNQETSPLTGDNFK